MNELNPVYDERLINFSINHVIRSFMLDRQMGVFNTVLNSYEFTDEEFSKLKDLIINKELPNGYYKLCDLIGRPYYDT